MINKLVKLGFSKSRYSEVLLSICCENVCNIAPMGVLIRDSELFIRVFRGGKTYELMSNSSFIDCVLNITCNSIMFYNAIFEKNKLKLVNSKIVSSKRVYGCDAYVECVLSRKIFDKDIVYVYLKPIYIEIVNNTPRVYNRVDPAIIEALVEYTKIPYYVKSNLDIKNVFRKFNFLESIVEHCSSDDYVNFVIRRVISEGIKLIKELKGLKY